MTKGPTDPSYAGFRVTEMWAWCAVDENGIEGAVAVPSPIGALPLIASDPVRAEQYRQFAMEVSLVRGVPVVLKHFTNMKIVETIIAPTLD